MKRYWLICGVLSSLFYVAMNAFIPLLFDGYSFHLTRSASCLPSEHQPGRYGFRWPLFTCCSSLLLALAY